MSENEREREQSNQEAGQAAEEAPASETSAAETPSEPGGEEPEPEAGSASPPSPDDVNVFDLLRAMIPLFVQEAWVALGVQARPGSAEVHTDLRCARVAIDTTQALVEKLGDEATDDERREFDQILTTLRINFVRRQAKAEA